MPQNSPVQSGGAVVAPNSVIFQIRRDSGRKNSATPKMFKKKTAADEMAKIASRAEDVSAYFISKFTAVKPVHRVNVDLTQGVSRELHQRAARLNISRQAVIKTLLARALNEDRAPKPVPRKKAG